MSAVRTSTERTAPFPPSIVVIARTRGYTERTLPKNHMPWDDDDDDDKNEQDAPPLETGNYDLGDDVGTRIGEHEEDPSI